ncbi:hypothetical protein [Microbacterium gubbeenense]|uniref:hypothetical protein n=1 Tax=Microbacterium gubbeenense TaxID=159896 RepID=UPI003F978FF9
MIDLLMRTPTPVIALAGVVLTALGGIAGAWIAAQAKRRETEVKALAAQVDAANQLSDQLQEELGGHRTAQEARITETERRLTSMEERNGVLVDRNDRYRDLLHKHRSHIWDGKPPPPPEWPDDLPR